MSVHLFDVLQKALTAREKRRLKWWKEKKLKCKYILYYTIYYTTYGYVEKFKLNIS